MKVVKFPEPPKEERITAAEWMRKVAEVVERDYGKEVFLASAVVTFSRVDGAVYFYDAGNDTTEATMGEIGLLGLAQQHLMNISAE